MLTVRVVVLERSQLHKNVSLEAFKMYCVMLTRFERAEAPAYKYVYFIRDSRVPPPIEYDINFPDLFHEACICPKTDSRLS